MINFSLIDDGENRLPIRLKLNALAQMLAVAVTDEAITAGAVTTIPVASLTCNLSVNLTKLIMLNIDTGDVYELALGLDGEVSDNAITITEYTFTDNVPAGCPIFLWSVDVANVIYSYFNS